MSSNEWLAEQFEASRGHLKAVAFRILGSAGEADDAIQECWLRVSRADSGSIENLQGWMTTVLARVCLNLLRSRNSLREEALPEEMDRRAEPNVRRGDPQEEALLAESVGLALLVVLEQLNPAERVAFVLHDAFGVTFDEIARIVKRSPAATRQLASRARRRVRGGVRPRGLDLSEERQTVEAFLGALRAGDMEGLLRVLDPGVVRRADKAAEPSGIARELRGAASVAKETMAYTRVAHIAQPVVVDEAMGFIVAPHGRLRIAIRCTVRGGKITAMDVVADPAGLRKLKFGVPPD